MNEDGITCEDITFDFILNMVINEVRETIVLSQLSCKLLYLVMVDKPYYLNEMSNDYNLLQNELHFSI
jgi:hypothetical protein